MHSEEINPCKIEDRLCFICEDGTFINCREIHNNLKVYGLIVLQKDRSTSAGGLDLCPGDSGDEKLAEKSLDEEDGASTRDALVLRPFKCSLCELVFDRISQLDNHKRSVHCQERSHVCHICGKGFFRETDLKTHLNIHLGTNKSMCEICGKKFNHVSNLIRHGRTHSGVKPYPCTICGKRFTQINTLTRHKAIHMRGDETLDCCFCENKYKTKNGLKKHMKKLHGLTEIYTKDRGKIVRRRHHCKICGESFQFVELLRDHETFHRNVKMLECRSCSQKFTKFEEIEEHRCDKANNSIGGDIIPFEESSFGVEDSGTSEPKTLTNNQLDPKSCHNVTFGDDKIAENKEVKESSIVYVRTEQIGNVDIELVDTANNFLHENLLELTTESNLQSGNMSSRYCENETVVSEMIKNCWKEIEMPDVTKHDSENIIYVEELEFDNRISDEIIDENLKTTHNDAMQESLLKLVQFENGQCVLELADNESDIVGSMESRMEEVNEVEKLSENDETVEGKNDPANKSGKIIYLAQNSRDCLIDLFETETLSNQEENNFNSISEELMQANFDNPQVLSENKSLENAISPSAGDKNCEELLFGLTQNCPVKFNKQSNSDGKIDKRDNGPMVRLVQNEDGAQFFELIRRDLEFEETEDFELVKMNRGDEEENWRAKNDAKNADNSGVESGFATNGNDEKIRAEPDVPRKKKLNTDGKKYNCDVCKKSFSKGYNYRQHIGTHFADQQKFNCKECGIFFAWKSTLNKHIASHKAGGQQKFVCEICPKVYTTLSQVNEHVKRDHLKERNHKCTHCSKTFFKKFDLKIHIRTHTKERPYECRVCYKSFHYQSHVIRHERIHSGERPYACNICEKAFTQLGSLKNHRQRHQELKIDILDYQMDGDDPLPQTTL